MTKLKQLLIVLSPLLATAALVLYCSAKPLVVVRSSTDVPLGALPAGYDTHIDDIMDDLYDRWTGNPATVTNGRDVDVGPYEPDSITSSGTTATVTFSGGHIWENGDTVMVRQEQGYELDEYGGAGAFGYNLNATVSNVTATTFDYTLGADLEDVPASGTPVCFWEPDDWRGTGPTHLGYYGPLYNVIGYRDWCDRRGETARVTKFGDSDFLQILVNGEGHRWYIFTGGARSPGYGNMCQAWYAAWLEDLSWMGSEITDADLYRVTDGSGAVYDAAGIVGGASSGSVPDTNRAREWGYLLSAMIFAERAGQSRHDDLDTLVAGHYSKFKKWMNEDNESINEAGYQQPFMQAIAAMSLIHFYDWELENARDPAAGDFLPSTIEVNLAADTEANPWTDPLDMLTDFYKWSFNYDEVAEDSSTPFGTNVGYQRKNTNNLGDPIWFYDSGDGDLLKGYLSTASASPTDALHTYTANILYWLAWRLKNDDPALALWFGQKGDDLLETIVDAPTLFYQMQHDGSIKEALQRIYYAFDGLAWRNLATGRND